MAVAFREFGFEGRNIKEDDTDDHMLQDDPLPVPSAPVLEEDGDDVKLEPIDVKNGTKESEVSENNDAKAESAKSLDETVKKEEVEPKPALPSSELNNQNNSNDSNESDPQEEPKALPVQKEEKTPAVNENETN